MDKNKKPINMLNLSCQILKSLRGNLSQRELSQKLGYSFNQVGKWESGATLIKWSDFFKLSDVLELPLEKSFRSIFTAASETFNERNSIRILDTHLVLRDSQIFVEYKSVSKWINGSSSPHFISILNAFNTRPGMLIGWLSYLLDCSQISELKDHYEDFLLRIETVYNDPNCVYVNAALQVRAYQDLMEHDDVVLATQAACTVSELKKTLQLLMKANIITWNGKKYEPCPFDFSFSNLPIARLRTFTKYSTQLAAEMYPTMPVKIDPIKTKNQSVSSVRVVAMSPSASRQVASLIAKFHNEISEIVKQDQLPKENVQILLLHSFASNITQREKNLSEGSTKLKSKS